VEGWVEGGGWLGGERREADSILIQRPVRIMGHLSVHHALLGIPVITIQKTWKEREGVGEEVLGKKEIVVGQEAL